MLSLTEANLQKVVAHKVGNQSEEEGYIASDQTLSLTHDLMSALRDYFLPPFSRSETYYKLDHPDDLGLNPVFQCCRNIFEDSANLIEQSTKVLEHLYAQSSHPHIKSGELFVAMISDCILEGEVVDAIGIFKAEGKDQFLQFATEDSPTDILVLNGIPVKKLDKGCLIFNVEEESGYRLLMVDQNRYDAVYWRDNFLQVRPDQDENFQTKQWLDLCQQFSNDVVAPQQDKQEQLAFLNKSVEYFSNHEQFDVEEFKEEVIEVPEFANAFTEYQKTYSDQQGFEPKAEFDISKPALKTAQRQIKNAITLDTHIQIKLDFNNPESSRQFLEKGYDERRQMYFYKVYFNEEKG